MEWIRDQIFQDVTTMSDDQLEREARALERWTREVSNSDEVSDYVKSQMVNHAFNVEQERRKRSNEDLIYPLEAFGITNFF